MPRQTKSIDPRALVSEHAEIDEGVSIGPFAIVEEGVVLAEGCSLGPGAILRSGVHLGRDCRIHAGAILGEDPQDLSFEGAGGGVHVGEGTVVREYATVHRASRPGRETRIGPFSYLMVQSHVAHDAILGERVIVCNGALIAGHARIGDRAFISGNVVIHQFCRVGQMVMLSGNTGISSDVGPYLTMAERNAVVGFNKVGMRRGGLDAPAQRRVIASYRRLFGARTLREGVAELAADAARHAELAAIHAFYSEEGRGFARPTPRRLRTLPGSA